MDKTNIDNYFGDIEFVIWGNIKHSYDCQQNRYFKDYYGLQFTPSGSLEYSVDDNPKVVDHNYPLLLTRPNHKYNYCTPNLGERHHLFICFRGNRVKKWIECGLFPKEHAINIFDYELCTLKMLEIVNYLNMPGKKHHSKIVNLIEALLIDINMNYHTTTISPFTNKKLKELINEIQATPQLEWNWENEARRLNLSLGHFRRLFKKETGLSPLQFLLEAKIQFAANYLITDYDISITEVAELSGFTDNFYFSRLFKKYKQLTPSNYKKYFNKPRK